MSKTLLNSSSNFFSSVKSGLFQSIVCQLGSRLPSLTLINYSNSNYEGVYFSIVQLTHVVQSSFEICLHETFLLLSVSNQSAISSKPSSLAVLPYQDTYLYIHESLLQLLLSSCQTYCLWALQLQDLHSSKNSRWPCA